MTAIQKIKRLIETYFKVSKQQAEFSAKCDEVFNKVSFEKHGVDSFFDLTDEQFASLESEFNKATCAASLTDEDGNHSNDFYQQRSDIRKQCSELFAAVTGEKFIELTDMQMSRLRECYK